MKKKRTIAMLALLCGIGVTAGAGFAVGGGALFGQYAHADQPELSEPVETEEVYLVGSQIGIPASGIRVDGKTYPATAALHFPDGTVRSAETVNLSEVGKYRLVYTAQTDGGAVSVTKEFFAADKFTDVSGKKSTTKYGTAEHAESRPGLVTSLAQGDRMIFNQRLNLTGKTKDDVIAGLFVTPRQQGTADAMNLVITLTDANDAENVITVTTKRVKRDMTPGAQYAVVNSYVTANAVGQAPTGLEAGGAAANRTFFYNGAYYNLHRNDEFGAGIRFSLPGSPNITFSGDTPNFGNPEDIANQTLSFSFDYAEKVAYMNGSIIADLDDPATFPTTLWEGFENGECYLTVSATSYNADSFNFVVTEFNGIEGEELGKNLYLIDKEKPVVSVDYGKYEGIGFPNAVVGLPYRVPDAIGEDAFDKNVQTSYRVYRDYGAPSATEVTVTEGKFTPAEAGEYTVVYTARDSFGNEGELTYAITAEVSTEEFTLSLSDASKTAVTGEELALSAPEVQNARGIAEVSVTAKHAASGTEAEIENVGGGYLFRPLYAGDWEIVYAYSDYIESKTVSYHVEAEASKKPYLYEDAVLPRYLVRGAAYRLPAINGYELATGAPVSKTAEAFIADDGGTERPLPGKKFISYADTEATIIYRLGSGENAAEKRYTVPVKNVGYDESELRIKDYFVGENFTSEGGDDRISLVTSATGTQSFEFINAVQTFDFRTLFYINKDANRYTKLNVYLIDSVDSSVVIKVSYTRLRAGNTSATVNDGATVYSVSADFTGTGVDSFRLEYDNGAREISPSTEYSVKLTTDLSGKEFTGFSGGKAYLRFELEGITGRSGVELLQLNNQPLSKIVFDLLNPEISSGAQRGEKYYGDKIVLPATVAADVLDPDITFTMSVKAPDGTFAVADDGTVLDSSADPSLSYVITATQYGDYVIEYGSMDTNENPTIYSYVVSVYDTTPPAVTLGDGATSAKVGETVLIKQATYTDNLSECTLMLRLRLPDGRFVTLPGNSFVANRAGTYTVFYMVYDTDGNATTVSYDITVE